MPTEPTAKVVAPGEARTIMLFAVRFDYKVTSADSGGALAALEVTIPPHTLVKPHNHSREDEYTVVLDGTVGARVGDRVVEAPAGASMVKPRGPRTPCGTSGRGRRGCRVLSRAASRTTSRSWPRAARAPPPAEYDALAERYGLTIENDWIEELERTYGVKL